MKTPAVLVFLLGVIVCLRELFQVVGLDSVVGLFSALFILVFLTLATWTYNRYSGKLRGAGKKIDDVVEWAWDVLFKRREREGYLPL